MKKRRNPPNIKCISCNQKVKASPERKYEADGGGGYVLVSNTKMVYCIVQHKEVPARQTACKQHPQHPQYVSSLDRWKFDG